MIAAITSIYRHVLGRPRTHFWIYLATLGKGGFCSFIFLVFVLRVFSTFLEQDKTTFKLFSRLFSF